MNILQIRSFRTAPYRFTKKALNYTSNAPLGALISPFPPYTPTPPLSAHNTQCTSNARWLVIIRGQRGGQWNQLVVHNLPVDESPRPATIYTDRRQLAANSRRQLIDYILYVYNDVIQALFL